MRHKKAEQETPDSQAKDRPRRHTVEHLRSKVKESLIVRLSWALRRCRQNQLPKVTDFARKLITLTKNTLVFFGLKTIHG